MPIDIFALESQLSAEDKILRDTVRSWVAEKFLSNADEYFNKGIFPVELVPALASMGVLGMQLDGYGCTGASALAYGIVCQELEYGDTGLRSFVSVQSSLAMYAIYALGSEEQKNYWLPKMAKGEVIGCFALTEPDAGSDPSSMRATAVKSGNKYIINGTKRWITNGGIAKIAIVWAKLNGKITGFIVPTETKGVVVTNIENKLSMRASVTSELTFQDCEVDEDSLLPLATGLGSALKCLNEARFGIVWGAVGSAQSCFDTALNYAKERTQFGKSISAFQLTQEKLAKMATEITKAQLLAFELAKLKERNAVTPIQISMAKMNNVRMALDVARTARTILAANGISLEYPVFRHMVNLESVLTYEGTEEVHTLIIGEVLTGNSAFK